MNKFRRESELFDPVAAYVYRRGFRWQLPEAPFYDYRIDLYGYSRTNMLATAIELKLTNWRRALEQTLVYQLTADLVYAAFPRYNITDTVISAFSTHGIGLIGVGPSGRCEQLLASRQSDDVRDWYRQHFISLIHG